MSTRSKRLNYVNHARRLADGDWTGADSDGEEDMEKQDEGERSQDDNTEEEGMEVERRRLPKHYANQVSAPSSLTVSAADYMSKNVTGFYSTRNCFVIRLIFFLLILSCKLLCKMFPSLWLDRKPVLPDVMTRLLPEYPTPTQPTHHLYREYRNCPLDGGN